MSKKPNAWVSFIKEWSVKNGLTYGCSISDPRAKAEYQAQKPLKVVKAKIIKSTNLNKAESIDNISALDFLKKQPKKKIDVVFPYKKFREEIETYDKENYSKALKGDINQDNYFSFMKAKLRILDKIKYPSNPIEHSSIINLLKGKIKSLTEFAQSKVKLSKPYVEPKIKKSKPLKPLADALGTLAKKTKREGNKRAKKIIIDNWTSKTLGFIFKEYDPKNYAKLQAFIERKRLEGNNFIMANAPFLTDYKKTGEKKYGVSAYDKGVIFLVNYITKENLENTAKVEKVQTKKDIDILNAKLQQLIYVTPLEKIKSALIKMKFKGRMQQNKMLLNIQIAQNFNKVEQVEELINLLS